MIIKTIVGYKPAPSARRLTLLRIGGILAMLGISALSYANCQGTPAQQRQCQADEAQERAEAQREAARERAQEQQERANQQQQAQQRAQEEAAQRAEQQAARQRADEAQERAAQQQAAESEQRARQAQAARQEQEQSEARARTRDVQFSHEANGVPARSNNASVAERQTSPAETRGNEGSTAHVDAASTVRQINSSRAMLGGINGRPIPEGHVAVRREGGYTVSANGGKYAVRRDGTIASVSSSGKSVAYRPNGQLRSIHTAALDVSRNIRGQRTVVVRHADGSFIVSTNRKNGYVQRPLYRDGRALLQRTSIEGGVIRTAVYTPYKFHGVQLVEYVPNHHFVPAFYGWAFYQWSVPVAFSWGWTRDPWFVNSWYADYFAPSPVYPSAAYWLTDYYLAQTLAYAYELESQPASADNSAAAVDASEEAVANTVSPITPELKQAIASEVEQQIAFENAASAQPGDAASVDGLPHVLVPNHLFLVNTPLSLTTADNQACIVSPGDVLQLAAVPSADMAAAPMTVASGRETDCPAGVQVMVTLQELQDMHNDFRQKLDAGLQALRDSQGSGGLPNAPASALVLPPHPVEESAPVDPRLLSELEAAQQEASAAEAQATNAAFAPQAFVANH